MSLSIKKYSLFLFDKDRNVIPCINESFTLKHCQEYCIGFVNHDSKRIDIDIEIDGRRIGVFRVRPNENVIIEHPARLQNKFVFYDANSKEAIHANLTGSVHKGLIGSIVITITPEKISTNSGFDFVKSCNIQCDGGCTGLGAESRQKYSNAESITRDERNKIIMCATMKLAPNLPISLDAIQSAKYGTGGDVLISF